MRKTNCNVCGSEFKPEKTTSICEPCDDAFKTYTDQVQKADQDYKEMIDESNTNS